MKGADFRTNGEADLLARLAAADFRIAFDVGANRGDWSLEAVNLWPRCGIHAFEVAPETFQRMVERFRSSENANRVTVNSFGLSDQTGTCQMYYFPEHPDLTCDLPRHNGCVAVPFQAEIMSGDEYCDSRDIGTVDYLKIDVEGAEYRVMKGFSKRIIAKKIHCLQFEYGAFSTQTRFLLSDYYALLSDSYWIGKIFPAYVDFKDYHWTLEDFRFSNFCCVSKLRPDLRGILDAQNKVRER